MTSTSFNVGVDLESKSSSRVLRPPGGGHTDIFGLKEPIVPEVRKEDNKRNASSILEGTNIEINQSKKEAEKPVVKSQQECKENKPTPPKENKPTPPKENEPTPPKETQEQQAQPRTRVPPGGFSSGLW